MNAIPLICGQLMAVGFEGTSLPSQLAQRLRMGERGGVIWFRRNIEHDVNGEVVLAQVRALNQSIQREIEPIGLAALIAVDQEGGRVQRLKKPVLQLPPMAHWGEKKDPSEVEHAAYSLGLQLASLGFSMNFAPVLDVHTNPENPVIGDRSFSHDPDCVTTLGLAYMRGLQRSGIASCVKHFPGHGDTHLDSHVALPYVRHGVERLKNVELVPFYAAVHAHADAMMTAHVVYEALDAQHPATLSKTIITELLRNQMGFNGVCISDDLLMSAVSPSGGANANEVASIGIQAIEAGCDLLILAYDNDAACALYEEMVHCAERDTVFRSRCLEAFKRVQYLRSKSL